VQLLFATLCDVCSGLKERIPEQLGVQGYLRGIAAA
jgi:hypothetical protein